MFEFATFGSKHRFDLVYAKRYRHGIALDLAPRFASPKHPRLRRGGADLFDNLASFALACDLPFCWNALPNEARSEQLDLLITESKRVGLCDGFVVAIRLSHNVAYVWEMARSHGLADVDISAVPEITGGLFAISAQDNIAPAPKSPFQLTTRQAEVLDWCKKGKKYGEIAEIMAISSKTVEFHMTNVMKKMGVNDKQSAILEAIKYEIISL